MSQEYQVDWLIQRIEAHLLRNIRVFDPSDLIEALRLIDQFELPNLTEKIDELDMLAVNNFKDIFHLDEFYMLSPKLRYFVVNNILQRLLQGESEKIALNILNDHLSWSK